jgi:hypothetical protein
MVWLDANNRPEAFVGIINSLEATSSSTLVHQPQVGEGSRKRSRDIPQTPFPEIWKEIVEEREREEGIRSDEEGEEHDCNRIWRAEDSLVGKLNLTWSLTGRRTNL